MSKLYAVKHLQITLCSCPSFAQFLQTLNNSRHRDLLQVGKLCSFPTVEDLPLNIVLLVDDPLVKVTDGLQLVTNTDNLRSLCLHSSVSESVIVSQFHQIVQQPAPSFLQISMCGIWLD